MQITFQEWHQIQKKCTLSHKVLLKKHSKIFGGFKNQFVCPIKKIILLIFLRMIWEQRCAVILMLTKEVENGWVKKKGKKKISRNFLTNYFKKSKQKCDTYFPIGEDAPLKAGPFTVELLNINTTTELTRRNLKLTYEDVKKTTCKPNCFKSIFLRNKQSYIISIILLGQIMVCLHQRRLFFNSFKKLILWMKLKDLLWYLHFQFYHVSLHFL